MKYKAIVFDKDGTLVDFDRLWVPAARSTAVTVYEKFGAKKDNMEDYLAETGVIGDTVDIRGALPRGAHRELGEIMHRRITEAGANVEFDVLFPYAISVYSASSKKYEDIYPICDGLREVLIALKDMGLKLAVITADGLDGAKMCLDKLGIIEVFDKILAFDGIHPSKPDPYYMNSFCEEFGLRPDEVIMVGDTETDMQFGINSGALPVGVGKLASNREHLLKIGAKIAFSDVSALPSWLAKGADI